MSLNLPSQERQRSGIAPLGLKVDVDTYRGTREGVPRLIELLKRHDADATFLFSLGPDHTGRAIRRAFRPGFMKKVQRTSVLEHYGLKTLLYGTLLPGPDIGLRCADILRSVRDAGFEVGIHTWDHVKWQDGVTNADAAWTAQQMSLATQRFEEVFGEPARTHGAAGWQMNRHALRLTQQHGFDYASDSRGTQPFIPIHRAEIIACPQIPTTLPTLDELIGMNGLTPDNVANHLLDLTMTPPSHGHGHVFTLHAELEGGKFAPVFDALLSGWKSQGYDLVALRDIHRDLRLELLPRDEFVFGEVPGRSGSLSLQGAPFLA